MSTDTPQRLPAPALACGCAACRERLLADFIRVIYASFDVADEKNLDLIAEREYPPVTTVVERVNAYGSERRKGKPGLGLSRDF